MTFGLSCGNVVCRSIRGQHRREGREVGEKEIVATPFMIRVWVKNKGDGSCKKGIVRTGRPLNLS